MILAVTGDKHGDASMMDGDAVDVTDADRAEYDGGGPLLVGDREGIASIAAECGELEAEGFGGMSMRCSVGIDHFSSFDSFPRFGSGIGGSSEAERFPVSTASVMHGYDTNRVSPWDTEAEVS